MSPQVGEVFGGYRIDEVLGRGGMGVVYRAWQLRVEQPVALKVLSPDLAGDPAYRGRFGREAAALARLDSPHVIRIYDHGEVDGQLYLAMQLVDGPDLSRVLASGPLPPHRALSVVAQVASALGDAHAVGVVHRDVKTGNVLLRPRAEHDDDDFVYLCDFGIARSSTDASATAETEQQTAGIVGTIGYLAPERIRGAPASAASDVYALGCLLWATLTSEPPYQGSQPQVIMAHVEAPVPQLVADDPRTAAVNALLAAMMAKDPGARPSVREVRDRIRRAVAPASAVPGPAPVRSVPAPEPTVTAPAPLRRRRWWAFAGAATLVVVAGTALVLLTGYPAGSAADRVAAATPVGVTCSPVAPSGDGVRAQSVCRPGPDVGDLRVSAFDSAGSASDYLRTGAGQDPAALTPGRCPADLPTRQDWRRDGHGGTLVCFVVGTTTRYAWTDDALATATVLDGRPATPYPSDLDAVDAFFAAARFG